MSRRGDPAAMRPPSTAANPVPGRMPHWIRGNEQERVPHRWIIADTEAHRATTRTGETQTLRLGVADFWRDDLASGDAAERLRFTEAAVFWQWVIDHCSKRGRTTLGFHNASYDLAILDAFSALPALGAELVWTNLDRDVSVTTWRTPGGTLIVWDTFTWCPMSLEKLSHLVGLPKVRLPGERAPDAAWWARCEADVDLTKAIARQLSDYVRGAGLGNWQPSGAGMGHTTWRHRHLTHKVLVHDDGDALAAEREAMHTGRAEAWWHGHATNGPFTEWDMHMSYCRIAAECDLPAKLWDYDRRPSARVHTWALDHWRVLARIMVDTPVPVVPVHHDGRITWPTGQFTTTLWDTELALLTEAGATYKVLGQWRYSRKPVLASWANWSITECGRPPGAIPPAAAVWVKHQSRAVIGRLALRTPTWEPYCGNWMPGYTGLSTLSETGQPDRRLMHVGTQVWREEDRSETRQSVPQITSWIMAEARARLWRATLAAGQPHVLHVDTDSLITNRHGTAALQAAIDAGLPGTWRPKATWRRLEVTGPRHYATPTTKQVPGVPRSAVENLDGAYVGEVWDSLAHALTEGTTGTVRTRIRTWQPRRVDHRRPYTTDTPGPAIPITLNTPLEGDNNVQNSSP